MAVPVEAGCQSITRYSRYGGLGARRILSAREWVGRNLGDSVLEARVVGGSDPAERRVSEDHSLRNSHNCFPMRLRQSQISDAVVRHYPAMRKEGNSQTGKLPNVHSIPLDGGPGMRRLLRSTHERVGSEFGWLGTRKPGWWVVVTMRNAGQQSRTFVGQEGQGHRCSWRAPLILGTTARGPGRTQASKWA
jgi:hypothetical protein